MLRNSDATPGTLTGCAVKNVAADTGNWLTGFDLVAAASSEMLAKRPSADAHALRKQRLNQFLAEIEGRAFTMANIATQNRDDALDIVQDAMISLVTRYGHKPEAEWRPLFYRILTNKITDCHRKRSGRSRFHFWTGSADDTSEHDAANLAPDPTANTPGSVEDDQTLQQIGGALQQLPARQQQAFMLRMWEGLSVRETAMAMKCSEGSVKTHLSRALKTLRSLLDSPA